MCSTVLLELTFAIFQHSPAIRPIFSVVTYLQVLRIHSALYIKNLSDRHMAFQLRIPDPFLSMQMTPSPGDQLLAQQEGLMLKALAPGQGKKGVGG